MYLGISLELLWAVLGHFRVKSSLVLVCTCSQIIHILYCLYLNEGSEAGPLKLEICRI